VTHTDDIREAFVQLWGNMSSFWGVPPTTARVLGWLLSQKEPQTAEELVDGLAMSRGAVSMACRELRDWGLIHAETVAGSRQLAYRPETDLEKAIKNIVAMRKRREWDPILERLHEWVPALDGERSEDARVFRERMAQIAALVGMADSMAESFLKGGLVQKLGLKALVSAAHKKSKGRVKR
jgi:DNA-binding transcriptional regulator GbsR (MarR family)